MVKEIYRTSILYDYKYKGKEDPATRLSWHPGIVLKHQQPAQMHVPLVTDIKVTLQPMTEKC